MAHGMGYRINATASDVVQFAGVLESCLDCELELSLCEWVIEPIVSQGVGSLAGGPVDLALCTRCNSQQDNITATDNTSTPSDTLRILWSLWHRSA
jgi:hypothetical protein